VLGQELYVLLTYATILQNTTQLSASYAAAYSAGAVTSGPDPREVHAQLASLNEELSDLADEVAARLPSLRNPETLSPRPDMPAAVMDARHLRLRIQAVAEELTAAEMRQLER
jgi:hypothetical protein